MYPNSQVSSVGLMREMRESVVSQHGFPLSDSIFSESDKPSSRGPTSAAGEVHKSGSTGSFVTRTEQSTGRKELVSQGLSGIILLRNIGRLFKCLLSSSSSLLIFSRAVIWSLFYFGAASPTSDRVGMRLMLAMCSLASDAGLMGCCTEKPRSCASNASSDL